MTPDERQLIADLFDRMRGYSLPEKDREAEALINEQVAGLRDAPYMLVQSVLVQEHALQQADARIRELEEQVQALESAAEQRPAAGSGGFLGGLLGGGRPESARGASVPAVGARATPSVYASRQGWTPQGPGQPGGPFAQAAQQPAGGGFLRSAMATAAGVAGGMLLAGAIGNMLGGGNSAHAATTPSADAGSTASSASGKETAEPQAQPQEASHQEAADSDGGWFGGDGGDFGGDLDI